MWSGRFWHEKDNPFSNILFVVTCNADLRTWTAVNGKEVEAEFLSNEKGLVKQSLSQERCLKYLSISYQRMIKFIKSVLYDELPDSKNTKNLSLLISKFLNIWGLVGKWVGDKSTNQIFISLNVNGRRRKVSYL